jgi:hypothetical protein
MTKQIPDGVRILATAIIAQASCAAGDRLDLNGDGITDYELGHYFDCSCSEPEAKGGMLVVALETFGANEVLVHDSFVGYSGTGAFALLPPGSRVEGSEPSNTSWIHPTQGGLFGAIGP